MVNIRYRFEIYIYHGYSGLQEDTLPECPMYYPLGVAGISIIMPIADSFTLVYQINNSE